MVNIGPTLQTFNSYREKREIEREKREAAADEHLYQGDMIASVMISLWFCCNRDK